MDCGLWRAADVRPILGYERTCLWRRLARTPAPKPTRLGQMEELPHLVVAHLQQQAGTEKFERADIRGVQMMLKRLFAKLSLSGHYAIRIERSRGITELMCAFEEERDADEAARTVGAAKTAPIPNGILNGASC